MPLRSRAISPDQSFCESPSSASLRLARQHRRRQFSSEYTFLALDLIVQREYPEVHTELLTEAERRMEAFHGGA